MDCRVYPVILDPDQRVYGHARGEKAVMPTHGPDPLANVHYRQKIPNDRNLCMESRKKIVWMEELTAALVTAIHDRIVTDQKSDPRILSEASLHQMVFQAELVPGSIPRAAFVFYSLCAFPPFREANAETAITLAEEILASGGYSLQGELSGIMAIADGIRAFTTEPEDVEEWFRAHTRKENSPG